MFGYKVYSWVVLGGLNKEIEVDQNPAVGLVLGAVIIGVSIIVAASFTPNASDSSPVLNCAQCGAHYGSEWVQGELPPVRRVIVTGFDLTEI